LPQQKMSAHTRKLLRFFNKGSITIHYSLKEANFNGHFYLKVFVPSSQVKESDWFVMDQEGKKRIMQYEFDDQYKDPLKV